MKTTKIRILLLMSFFALLVGCSDDDDAISVDSTPEFQSLVEEISSLPGETFTFRGVFTDPAGISSVNMNYEPWFLDKTIVKNDSIYETYELAYSFLVPEDAVEGSEHIIPITISNRGGVTATRDVVITLDQDIENPVITVASPSDGATAIIGDGAEIVLNVTVTDDELMEFVIESELVNETIAISGTSYNYTNDFDLSEPGNYTFNITATDTSGNSSSTSFSVNVANELNFLNMYLTDTNAADFADSYFAGLPRAGTGSTVSGEEGFVFSFRHYAETDNAEVYFTAQRTSFDPFAFGRDVNQDGNLVLASAEDLVPIILPTRGYYDISMDLRDLSYTVTSVTAPEDPMNNAGFDGVFVTGSGISVDGQSINQFNPATSAPMQVDPNNPQRYSATVEFIGTNVSFIFIGNQASYSVFWRVNNGPVTTTTAIVPQGGTECTSDIQYAGSYQLTVDVFLNTFTMVEL